MLKPEKFYDKKRLHNRLMSKTRITEDNHWLWIGKTTIHKRGVMSLAGKFRSRTIEVHRVSAFVHLGLDLFDGNSHALHKNSCPYKNCWNPQCLYVGTHQDNMRDIANLPNFRCGHAKTYDNIKFGSNHTRRCKTCANVKQKELRRLKKTQQPTIRS